MSIYVTGDCHADFTKFSTTAFPEQKEMTKDDFVIVCGDFGIWNNDPEERWWLQWLNDKPFTTLFVTGNHENFDRLYSNEFEAVDFHGGKAKKIRDSIYCLMRGNVFELQGKKFFCFGGASSHDIDDGIIDPADFKSEVEMKKHCKKMENEGKYMFRIKGRSWWPEELPSQEEMDFGLKTLEDSNFKVDFIVSHCAPQHIATYLGGSLYKPDCLTQYFNEIDAKTTFKKWVFGHFHDNLQIMKDYILLYEQIIRIV